MHRRELLKLSAATIATSFQPIHPLLSEAIDERSTIEQWGVYEVVLEGPNTGNPFQDVTLSAHFTLEHRSVEVAGFYDGDGTYRIRFMPDTAGLWSYVTTSSSPSLAK
jgi:hypothetical protein